jgi:hypothetical protein
MGTTITGLSSAGSLAAPDLFPVVQGGVTKHATLAQVLESVPELIRDTVGSALVAGSGATITVDDAGDKITIAATGGGSSYTDEQARDAAGAALTAGAGISIAVDDAGDKITITNTGTGSGSGGGVLAAERMLFVSKGGSDSNDGLSWKSAFLTVAAARTALSFYNGVIHVGYGNFLVDHDTLSLRATQCIQGITTQGSDGGGSALVLNGNGVLLNLDGQTNPVLKDITLAFGSASQTGTLVSMSGTFTATFINVRFRGVGASGFNGSSSKTSGIAGQNGVSLTNNTGDCKFLACEWELLDIGVNCQTTINAFVGCNWTSCLTAYKGGDLTGAQRLAGAWISGGTMRGWGNYYIDAAGSSYAWHVDGVFFDGQATTAIRIGNIVSGTGYGPWAFKLASPNLNGAVTSVELNSAIVTVFDDGTVWGDSYTDGAHPTELVVHGTSAMLPKGKLGTYLTVQGHDLGALLPTSGWTKAAA